MQLGCGLEASSLKSCYLEHLCTLADGRLLWVIFSSCVPVLNGQVTCLVCVFFKSSDRFHIKKCHSINSRTRPIVQFYFTCGQHDLIFGILCGPEST